MENKNNMIDEFEARHACHEQVSLLFGQPFERQREALLDMEGKVRAFVGGDPEELSCHNIKPHDRELRLLMLQRFWLLNRMFKETPEAYERMRKVNQHLYDMTRQLREQMADICGKLAKGPRPSFVNDYEVKGVLGFNYDDKESVSPMSIDRDYGSDYPLMVAVNECLWDIERPNCGSPYLGMGLEFHCRYDEAKEDILHDGLDDGISWAHELPTPFEGLCICHTTAAFVRDLHYPVFDLLHLNDFWSEVNVAYQHFSQQLS